MSLSIILTCYNEVPMIFDSYEKVVSMMNLTKIEYEVIVVDDGSEPEIKKQLSAYFQKKPDTPLIFSELNEGRGAAVTKGIKASSKEYVGFIDTDLEIPEYSLLGLYYSVVNGNFDVIIGKRIYLLKWNIYNWFRYFCSRTYFLFANFFLKLGFLDSESGVKLFKRQKIMPILDSVQNKRWFWDTEIVAESIKNNLKITQLPVFVIRKDKRSSVRFFRDAYRYLGSLCDYRKRRRG